MSHGRKSKRMMAETSIVVTTVSQKGYIRVRDTARVSLMVRARV